MRANVTWKGRLAQFAITVAACGLFLVLRPDYIPIVRAHASKLSAQGEVDGYLAAHKIRKLQIGAGDNNFADWLNTDLFPGQGQVFLDATRRFPMADGTIHYIFAEHVIEHVTFDQGNAIVRECQRVLAPGGRIRLVTPNLDRFVALFTANPTEQQRGYMAGKAAWHRWPQTAHSPTFILNMQLREWGHQFVYTPGMLISILEQAGFKEVREFQADQTGDDGFKGLDVRPNTNVAAINLYEAMAIEGVR